MKFIIPGKEFQRHLQAMSRVLSSKNALQILENFLLKVEGNQLTIIGSDSENTMVSWLEIFEVDGEGEVVVSSRTLSDLAKEIGNQPITFEMNDDTRLINVSYLNGHLEFMGLDPAEYPRRAEDNEETKTIVLPAEVVSKGIENTLYAVSSDTLRPMLTGIFWDFNNDSLTFVSSDTHKLVRYINRQVAPDFEGGFILPSKPAAILKNIITDEDTEVKITMNSKGATFEVGSYKLSSKFVKGNYPNYNRVIPQSSPFSVTVSRETLLNAVRRVSLFASKSTSLVKITIDASNMHLEARDIDYSTMGEENVPCSYDGNPMTIGFSTNYMVDILTNLKFDDIKISLSDPVRPGIYEPVQQNPDEDILVLQMPIQVLE